ncbi:hypothetical protein BESB_044660 [Besnoitia besnoiti]|uniref:Uncharacterized protein n=1 Tax=Besnoitia besnoiti TaxID=94643 RepID=A0A2A9MGH9_BESBE|nr:hypothetical protein BESB_044660 [Besnoitia besnoiti]PFH36274.1 hypothetical protein BESB_044660 [Besnoitia besnoiti]
MEIRDHAPSLPSAFVRLLGRPVRGASASVLTALIEQLSKDLEFRTLSEEGFEFTKEDNADGAETDGVSSRPLAASQASPLASCSAALETGRSAGEGDWRCRASCRRAVLSSEFMSQVRGHLDACATADSSSEQKLELAGARLAWSFLLLQAVSVFWESEKESTPQWTPGPCVGDLLGGRPASVEASGEAAVSVPLETRPEEEVALSAGTVDVELVLSGLISGLEAVLTCPSASSVQRCTCVQMLKRLRGVICKHMSDGRPDRWGSSTTPPTSALTPSTTAAGMLAEQTSEDFHSRVLRRLARSIFFVKTPSLICSVAHFVDAAARPPPGEGVVCMLSSPARMPQDVVHSRQSEVEQIEAYRRGLVGSLKLILSVVTDEAGVPGVLPYAPPTENVDAELLERILFICTPPSMLWQPEGSPRSADAERRYERLLPSRLRGYELVFGDRAEMVRASNVASRSALTPSQQSISPERAIRDATSAVAALVEALLAPLQTPTKECELATTEESLPVAKAWQNPAVVSLGADIRQKLRHAVSPSEAHSTMAGTHHQPSLSENSHTRLICKTCSLLLSCKKLPPSFDGSTGKSRRQLLPLAVAVDVASAQTGIPADSFRDKISGAKCLPHGLSDENVVRHSATVMRGAAEPGITRHAKNHDFEADTHLGDTSAMLLCFMVARVFLNLLRSLAVHEADEYSRLTVPILLRLVDIPQPHIRRIGWTCFCLASKLLSPSDAAAFRPPLLRAIHDAFPVCNEVPGCVDQYLSAAMSAFEALFPDPTDNEFLTELQFVTNMCLVTLSREPSCLASCLRHFQGIVKRARSAVTYISAELMKLGIRAVESHSPVAVIEGVALLRELLAALGNHGICFFQDVLCRLVMIYITYISPVTTNQDHCHCFTTRGSKGNVLATTGTQSDRFMCSLS